MARTAIVNPRRRRRSTRRKPRRYGRRRNPSTSDRAYNPRRRRRTRRRRNPAAGSPASSPYSSGGYRRRPNPDMFDFDRVMDVMPAATLGVWAVCWAAKLAGPFEDDKPGFKHALAMVLGASVGSNAIGSMLGSDKSEIAYIGALGFTGDLFARRNLFNDSEWVKDNLMLSGVDPDAPEDDAEDWDQDMSGFESTSQLGAGEPQLFVGPDGTLYEMSGAPDPANFPGGVAGFESTSALGGVPSQESSFGYAR